jgi:hypothetical protein
MLTDLSIWLIFIHVASAFLFIGAHGVSMIAAYRIRNERDPARIGAMLDLSASSLMLVFVGLLGLLISGFAAGWLRDSFGAGWFWASVVLLIVIGGLMTPLGANYYSGIRRAIGQRPHGMKPEEPDPVPVSAEELESLLTSNRPELLLALGGGGFVIILWLMMFRPF